jgi:hypothetical protein
MMGVIIAIVSLFAVFLYKPIIRKFKFTERRFRMLIAAILFIWIAIPASVALYNKNKIVNELMTQGIYEFENSFTVVSNWNEAYAFYMICEPPDTQSEMRRTVEKYLEEHQIVDTLRARVSDDAQEATLRIIFHKPSKEFPIGVDPNKTGWFKSGGFLEGGMLHYRIMDITIPWNAKTKEDYKWKFIT